MVKVILLLWWCCINRLWRKFIFAGTLFVPLRVSAEDRCAGLHCTLKYNFVTLGKKIPEDPLNDTWYPLVIL